MVGESTDNRYKETERVRRLWDRAAPKYDRMIAFSEKVLFSGGRRWVCSRAAGDVLEVAIGTGRNFEHYPEAVRLTGIDLSGAMLAIARQRAREVGRDADLRVGDAQALAFPDERFDTVVCTLSLCSIPDDRQAVAEMKRVLRGGGRLLLLEHVRSPHIPVRAVLYLLNPLTVRLLGDHMIREPLDHVRAEGLVVDELERSKWGFVERLSARKPG